MRKLFWILMACMVLCCCNRHSATTSTVPIKDSINPISDMPWLDTLDINIETVLLNMGMYSKNYREYGIKGFVMPKDTAFLHHARELEIYPGDDTDVAWAIYHANRFIYTDSMLRLMRQDPSKRLYLKVRTTENHADTIVNHIQITFKP